MTLAEALEQYQLFPMNKSMQSKIEWLNTRLHEYRSNFTNWFVSAYNILAKNTKPKVECFLARDIIYVFAHRPKTQP